MTVRQRVPGVNSVGGQVLIRYGIVILHKSHAAEAS